MSLKPTKQNLPFILMDVVLGSATLAKVPPGVGQVPEFRLIIADMEGTRKKINSVLKKALKD